MERETGPVITAPLRKHVILDQLLLVGRLLIIMTCWIFTFSWVDFFISIGKDY